MRQYYALVYRLTFAVIACVSDVRANQISMFVRGFNQCEEDGLFRSEAVVLPRPARLSNVLPVRGVLERIQLSLRDQALSERANFR